ncbi:DUF3209 family protein [Halorutilales archaeon Cl-col2-1]
MSCQEIEALRLGLMNVIGIEDRSAERHAEKELGDALEEDGPLKALANAESLSEIQRHLDAAIVDLEDKVANADESRDDYEYLRGLLLTLRETEKTVERLSENAETFFEGLSDSHEKLHETFPVEE